MVIFMCAFLGRIKRNGLGRQQLVRDMLGPRPPSGGPKRRSKGITGGVGNGRGRRLGTPKSEGTTQQPQLRARARTAAGGVQRGAPRRPAVPKRTSVSAGQGKKRPVISGGGAVTTAGGSTRSAGRGTRPARKLRVQTSIKHKILHSLTLENIGDAGNTDVALGIGFLGVSNVQSMSTRERAGEHSSCLLLLGAKIYFAWNQQTALL